MVSMLQKLRVLLWKCLILRKRNWLLTLFELVCPLLVASCAYKINQFLIKGAMATSSTNRAFGTFPLEHVLRFPVAPSYMAYTPKNQFTDQIMANIDQSVNGEKPISIKGFNNETTLEEWLRNNTLNKQLEVESIGIVFLVTNSEAKTFKYKIRTNSKGIRTDTYKDNIPSFMYRVSSFLGSQARIDSELLKSVGVSLEAVVLLIGRLPALWHVPESVSFLFLFLTVAYIFLMASIVRDVIQEKASGIKELMKIMGVSSWTIWMNWFMYTMIVHLPVSLGMTFFLAVLEPVVIHVNAFIAWLLILLFTINCIFLSFAASCLFNGPVRAVTICIIVWLVLHLSIFGFERDPGDFGLAMQVLLCLVPVINLYSSISVVQSFFENGVQWSLTNFFDRGFTGLQIPVGLSMMIFVFDTIIFAVIMIFLDGVKPGPYGVAKPANFICQWVLDLWRRPSGVVLNPPTFPGSTLPDIFEPPPEGSHVGIRIRDLRKEYGWLKKTTAVDNLNLDIYEGEIMALLGHNGAGKTTTMSMIAGMFSPTSGVIAAEGSDTYSSSPTFRESLGLCPQHNIYFPKLTVIEHLLFFGMLKGMSYDEAKRSGLELLDWLNITKKKDSKVSTLPGGMKRRLCLALSMVGNPKVLILDEPTSGLDPETRRNIWNIILGMQGQRTVLITTHFMEEADILGDRIAIMDHGRVVCCGTTMFLKKLYGTGYHIHILKKPNSPFDDIIYLVTNITPTPEVKFVSPSQIDFIINENFVNMFPKLFESLEKHRSSLGITGISVTCTSMEDVFLKVSEKAVPGGDIVNSPENPPTSSLQVSASEYEKTEGTERWCQQFESLIKKRFIYRKRNLFSFLAKTLFTSLIILLMTEQSHFYQYVSKPQEALELSLSLYPDSINPMVYDTANKNYSYIATDLIRSHGGKVITLPTVTDLTEYSMERATEDYHKYSQRMLLALSFIGNNFSLQYQPLINLHMPPIAVNFMANVLLRHSTDEKTGSITVINHPYVLPNDEECGQSDFYMMLVPILWLFYFSCALITIVPDCSAFIIEERVSGFKHQQLLAGVPSLLYWVTNFIVDYAVYFSLVTIYLAIILMFGSDWMEWNTDPMNALILVLLLLGVSGISFVYMFTYFIDSKVMSYAMFLMLGLAVGQIAAFVVYLNIIEDFQTFLITTTLFSFHPLFSATLSIAKISNATIAKHICETCGEYNCQINNLLRMPTDDDRSGILLYVIFLGLNWILYSVVIMMFDWELGKRIVLLFSYQHRTSETSDDVDDDVGLEAERVRLFRGAEIMSVPLRVDNLVKQYLSGPRAVKNVSFLVTRGECFGVLGVNGAGKTTLFKMLTGDSFPSSGDAFVKQFSVITNTKSYMTSVGYCPQFDAVLKNLTGKETLTHIAQLRGIPRGKIKREVENWFERLGITEHEKKRTFTYSGGTKRKLSTAMAFIGDPEVVFLDEPTTGVDPVSRRMLWNVVQDRQRDGRAVVLTSHSMEECEALCSRLTILSDGQMVCIGTSEYLKKKFGKGYTVLVKLVSPTAVQLAELKNDFSETFTGSVVRDEHFTLIHYQLTDPRLPLSTLFSQMLRLQLEHDIVEDFSVSNTTLEQLFLSFVKPKKTSTSRRTGL